MNSFNLKDNRDPSVEIGIGYEENKKFPDMDLTDILDYGKIEQSDSEEILKMFYYLELTIDFKKTEKQVKNPSESTMVFLINNFYKTRDDETVKRYLDKVSVESLKQKTNNTELNILEILSSHGSKINYKCHQTDSYLIKHNPEMEDVDLLKIYEYICSKKPQLITERCFVLAKAMNNLNIFELLTKYKPKPVRNARHYGRDYSRLLINSNNM